MKKIFLLAFTAIFSISAQAQDCDIPQPYSGNTGSNMTVLFTPSFVSSLDLSDNAYILAYSDSGLLVGTVYKNDPNGGEGLSQGQGSIAVWGDDTDASSPELDGALANQHITFQLVENDTLYDLILPDSIFYNTNAFIPVLGTGSKQLVDCTGGSDGDDTGSDGVEIVFSLSNGWNMVGYVGSDLQTNIPTAMDNAMDGQTIAETFEIIKNVSGSFWTPGFALLNDFTAGEGYFMYVLEGMGTDVNFQKSEGYRSGISFSINNGWNMVAFTGDINSEKSIPTAMNSAMDGQTIVETFEIIKNVSGSFWTPGFALLNDFTPGEAYFMYVLEGKGTDVNFQR